MKTWTFIVVTSVLLFYLHVCFSFYYIKQKLVADQIAEIYLLTSSSLVSTTSFVSLNDMEWFMYWFHFVTNYLWIRLYLIGPNVYNIGFWGGQGFEIICQQLSPKSPPLYPEQCLLVIAREMMSFLFGVQFSLVIFMIILMYRVWESEVLTSNRIKETLLILEHVLPKKRIKKL